MSVFNKIITKTDDELVALADSFKEVIHKELCLGMTRYVCRHGTLGDGHEKITDAQRYYQAIKEMWTRRNSVQEQKAVAYESQANLLDAEELLAKANTPAAKLRATAKKMRAENQLFGALITVEDLLRQLDEFNKVRLELKDAVTAKYPGGIEEAEHDSWQAVAQYRLQKEKTPGLARERFDNIPLDVVTKARIGASVGRSDAMAGFLVQNQDKSVQLPEGVDASTLTDADVVNLMLNKGVTPKAIEEVK